MGKATLPGIYNALDVTRMSLERVMTGLDELRDGGFAALSEMDQRAIRRLTALVVGRMVEVNEILRDLDSEQDRNGKTGMQGLRQE